MPTVHEIDAWDFDSFPVPLNPYDNAAEILVATAQILNFATSISPGIEQGSLLTQSLMSFGAHPHNRIKIINLTSLLLSADVKPPVHTNQQSRPMRNFSAPFREIIARLKLLPDLITNRDKRVNGMAAEAVVMIHEYAASEDPQIQELAKRLKDAFLKSNRSYVSSVAYKLSRGNENISLYINSGLIGLMEAVDRFDSSKNDGFYGFASTYVRGRIIDTMRDERHDRLSRSEVERLKSSESQETGISTKQASELPKGKRTDASIRMKIGTMNKDISEVTSYEDSTSITAQMPESPEEALVERESAHTLHKAIQKLPARDRGILYAYYFEQKTAAQAGIDFGVTESRVSQILKECRNNLKNILEKEGF